MFSAAQVFIGGVQTQATIVSSRLALAETPEGLGAGRFSVTATNGGLEGGGPTHLNRGRLRRTPPRASSSVALDPPRRLILALYWKREALSRS